MATRYWWGGPFLLLDYVFGLLGGVLTVVVNLARWAWEVAFPTVLADWRPKAEPAPDIGTVQRIRVRAFLRRLEARSSNYLSAGVGLRLAVWRLLNEPAPALLVCSSLGAQPCPVGPHGRRGLFPHEAPRP